MYFCFLEARQIKCWRVSCFGVICGCRYDSAKAGVVPAQTMTAVPVKEFGIIRLIILGVPTSCLSYSVVPMAGRNLFSQEIGQNTIELDG